MSDGWSQLMQNPRGIVLKKFIAQIVGQKVEQYDDVIMRVSSALITDNDLKTFGEMINDIMVIGYRKAVEHFQEQLKDSDMKINPKN